MTLQQVFLDQFDADLHPHILEFGKRLSVLRADVLVVMARKAACFVQALQDLGLTRPDAIVTTDRVLDMSQEWLRGCDVAIIDEALISGTTLYKTQNRLNDAGARSVTLHAFCVNTESWVNALASPERPYLQLSDKQTAAFCADVVNGISLLPLPYSVDYPHLGSLTVPATEMHKMWSVPGWTSHDLTSSLQREHDVVAFTMIPSFATQREVDDDFGWTLSRHSQLMKVRIFARYDRGSDAWACQVVPMVVLDPISPTTLRSLWECVLSAAGTLKKEVLASAFTTATSQLRLIQYLVASRIGRMYVESARFLDRRILDASVPTHQSLLNVFTPATLDVIEYLMQRRSDILAGAAEEPIQASDGSSDAAIGPIDFWAVQQTLTRPFIELYERFEVPARQLAFQHETSVFENPEFRETIDRLSMGYSVAELRQLIASDVPLELQPTVVSLFLDLAIDHGIVVPVTREHPANGRLYRAYRHGEDVLFGEAEERLIYLMVSAFLKKSNRPAAPRLWVEKLVVLLLRIGVQQGFLKRSYGTLGEDGTIGVRFALKGAVAKVEQPRLYGNDFDNTVTNALLRSGVLEQNSEKLYRVGREPDSHAPTKAGGDSKATLIGSIFGMLHSGGEGVVRRLSDREMILLATCPTANDVCGAVAAEIGIFQRAWQRYRHLVREMGDKTDAAELLEFLSSAQIVEALSSGEWKHRSFAEGMPWAIVDEVSASFTDEIHRETWRTFWAPSGQQNSTSVNDALEGLIAREGQWLLEANLALRLLQLSLAFLSSGATRRPPPATTEMLLTTIERLAASVASPEQRARYANLRRQIDGEKFKAEEVRKYAERQLDRLQYDGRGILDRVDVTVTAYGRPVSMVSFPHAMFVTIATDRITHARHWTFADKIVINHRGRMGDGTVARIDRIPDGIAGYEHGFWVCANGREGRSRLIQLAAKLLEKMADVTVRIALFTDMPPNEQLHLRNLTSAYIGTNFWTRAAAILASDNDLRSSGPQLTCYTAKSTLQHGAAKVDLTTAGLAIATSGERVYEDPTLERFAVQTFAMKRRTLEARPRGKVKHKADIGIINIVTEEVRASLAELDRNGGWRQLDGRRSAHIFYEGELHAKDGRHVVAVTQQLEQGNRAVISAYEALKREYSPALIAVVGIGGGIHADAGLGDVVIGDSVIYYDARKVTAAGPRRRGAADRIPAWLKPQLNHFFVLHEEPAEFEATEGSPKPRFRVRMGPIGCGEAVLGYRDAAERKWLLETNDKTLVVETEAKGIASAFYEEELEFDASTKGYVVVRGVSDHADEEKNDLFRKHAAMNAMTAFSVLVRQMPRLSAWDVVTRR